MTTAPPTSLARRVTATAWYIGVSVVFLVAGALLFWSLVVVFSSSDAAAPRAVGYVIGSLAVLSGLTVQLVAYHRDGRLGEAERAPLQRRVFAWQPGLTALGAVLIGVATGSILLGLSVVVTALCVIRWPRGVRLWGVVLATVALVFGAFAMPMRIPIDVDTAQLEFAGLLFAVGLPSMTALSLWSWDVVAELDRARTTEARLAATQERLRLAAELHDLQGHHLQVIALQLELAERMLARDPAAAGEQIRLAQASVDEARSGTRALAGRFRGVPLPDELANAADLLRAAGVDVRLDVAREAGYAPADLLGPVVREVTTNILKHGGGAWAQLRLEWIGAAWRLSAANDTAAGDDGLRDLGAESGSAGLAGITHRVGAVGGSVRADRAGGRFEVTVTVPGAVPAGPSENARSSVPGEETR
ncbi:sensor histidine kinase [Microbacterium telephonicum]|uniref:sensor histidine kinase n=1 Tax=Microbacterium telephonicum TaxID=1714841 RepID=UPI001F5427DD|nr:histidine kinase [Microbacterium telephonicum]